MERNEIKNRNVLVVVDMQNDFVDAALGTANAVAIVPNVVEKVKSFSGKVIFTRDTHPADYLQGREGKLLPVEHCIKGTPGWELIPQLQPLAEEIIDKPTFGSVELGERLRAMNEEEPIGSITLIGLCTDICVISNAMLLRAFLPETPIAIDASCCAGVTPESHETALKAMEGCQFTIL